MGRKIKYSTEGQAPLPLFAKRSGAWAYVPPVERRIIAVLGALLLVLAAVYMYSVMSSVMSVAKRQALSIEAKQLGAEVARLEAEYLTRTDAITESYAREAGYVAIRDRSFVEQSSAVTLNTR